MRDLTGGIAFFDSGIGGLTVLAACQKRIKGEIFYYYGDNARAPYGNLPVRTIREMTMEVFQTFARMRVKAAVVACNTVTAVCIEELRRTFPFPIVGVEPAVFPAAKVGGEAFVLTTRATHESARFQKLCQRAKRAYPQTVLRPFACDNLAGEIERRLTDKTYDCTPSLPKGSPDAVVLGCTHYVYMKEQIAAYYGCPVYDGNAGTAKRLSALCGREERPLLSPKAPEENAPVLFMGSGKAQNEHIYEQMFAKMRGF